MGRNRVDRLAEVMSECADLREQLAVERGARAQSVELMAQALATASSAHRGPSEVNKLAAGIARIVRKHGQGAQIPE